MRIEQPGQGFRTGALISSLAAPTIFGKRATNFRIAQEALTNVVHHARARTGVVRIAVDGDVVLEIVDDGVGIPTERSAGVGLSSMHERASELGGSCTVESVPKGGTRVLVHLPLSKE